jgi:hypothetical protein
MPFIAKEFHHHSRGEGDTDRYSLARDRDSGRVIVFHEWSRRRGTSPASGSNELDLGAFLAGSGIAQDKLRALIGTLVEE